MQHLTSEIIKPGACTADGWQLVRRSYLEEQTLDFLGQTGLCITQQNMNVSMTLHDITDLAGFFAATNGKAKAKRRQSSVLLGMVFKPKK